MFVAEAGERLPQAIVKQEFYDIFTSTSALQKLLTTRSKELPRYLSGWSNRTYGPGEECPETVLVLEDLKCWKTAMGIHPLPLAYPLRNSQQFANAPERIRETCGMSVEDPLMFRRSTGEAAEPRVGAGNGTVVNLSKLQGRGVLFVVACRVTDEENNRIWTNNWVKALNRFSLPVFMEKRKRTNAIADRNKNEKNRPGKKTASNVLREAESRRKKLLEKAEKERKKLAKRRKIPEERRERRELLAERIREERERKAEENRQKRERQAKENRQKRERQAEENRKKRELKAEKNRETLAKVKILEKRILARK